MHPIKLKRPGDLPIETAAIKADQKTKPSKPLSVLVITAGDDLIENAEVIARNMASAKKESVVLRLDEYSDLSADEQVEALEDAISDLYEQGRIGPETQVIINMHGSADGHSLKISDVHGKVGLDAIEVVDFLHQSGNPKIHFWACQAGNLRDALAAKPGTCFLHSGQKNLTKGQADELMREFCHFLGVQTEPPTGSQIFSFFEGLAGENIAMTGGGEKVIHKTDDYERHYGMQLGSDGIRHPSALGLKKARRVFSSKLNHGSNEKVVEMLNRFGDELLTSGTNVPHYHIARGGRDVVQKFITLLKHGRDVNDLGHNGFSALHSACHHGDIRVARQLLRAGADPDLKATEGKSPLSLAMNQGSLKIAKLLLERGADPYGEDRHGNSMVAVAIKRNDLDALRLLLEFRSDPGPIIITPKEFAFAISTIKAGQADIVILKEMVRYSTARKTTERTELCNELMRIAKGLDVPAVEAALISLGANDQTEKIVRLRGILEAAIQNGNMDIFKKMLSAGLRSDFKLSSGISVFDFALAKGEVEMAKMLRDADIREKANSEDGDILLAAAIKEKDVGSLKTLLRERADPDLKSIGEGRAPSLLQLAVLEISGGRADIGLLEILSEAGENMREAGKRSNLVRLARDLQSPELARELIRLGATGKMDDVDQKVHRPPLKRSKIRN